jgi:hypothetical protein
MLVPAARYRMQEDALQIRAGAVGICEPRNHAARRRLTRSRSECRIVLVAGGGRHASVHLDDLFFSTFRCSLLGLASAQIGARFS